MWMCHILQMDNEEKQARYFLIFISLKIRHLKLSSKIISSWNNSRKYNHVKVFLEGVAGSTTKNTLISTYPRRYETTRWHHAINPHNYTHRPNAILSPILSGLHLWDPRFKVRIDAKTFLPPVFFPSSSSHRKHIEDVIVWTVHIIIHCTLGTVHVTYTPFTHTTKSHHKSSLVIWSCNRVKSSSFLTVCEQPKSSYVIKKVVLKRIIELLNSRVKIRFMMT